MSFILDALRKSEHERQRQTGPALAEVAVATPKARPNRWATAAIALLVVNLVAIAVLLLVKTMGEPAATADANSPATANAPVQAAQDSAPPTASRAAMPQASITQTLPETPVAPPPMVRPAVSPPPAGSRNSLEQEMSGYEPPMEPGAAAAASAPPPGPAAVTPVRPGTVVYQSLPEADAAAAYQPQQAQASQLPLADDMTARGTLPEMRLELHVWSNKPQERFAFVNGRRYREGDTTAEGATVEEITREGVIMNLGGNRFLLSRD